MTPFYEYEFISPEYLYAEVKEELKSYFDTGAVDDLLFPLWTKRCLRKLGRGTLPIYPATVYLENYSAHLPSGFKAVREAWLCTNTAPVTIRRPGATYSFVTNLLNPSKELCDGCDPCTLKNSSLVYKTTEDELFTNTVSHLLRPGNKATLGMCGDRCPNAGATSSDTFVIQEGKIHTNFKQGDIFMTYYSEDLDDINYPMVPESEPIEEYIKAEIKYGVFTTLWNQITDETYNQIEGKVKFYKQERDIARIIAQTEVKKQTIDQKIRAQKRQNNRFNQYRIS